MKWIYWRDLKNIVRAHVGQATRQASAREGRARCERRADAAPPTANFDAPPPPIKKKFGAPPTFARAAR